MPRPVHFDMTAEDPTRAVQFYGNVFGWTFQKWDGPMDYWLITTGTDGPGIDGGLSGVMFAATIIPGMPNSDGNTNPLPRPASTTGRPKRDSSCSEWHPSQSITRSKRYFPRAIRSGVISTRIDDGAAMAGLRKYK